MEESGFVNSLLQIKKPVTINTHLYSSKANSAKPTLLPARGMQALFFFSSSVISYSLFFCNDIHILIFDEEHPGCHFYCRRAFCKDPKSISHFNIKYYTGGNRQRTSVLVCSQPARESQCGKFVFEYYRFNHRATAQQQNPYRFLLYTGPTTFSDFIFM